MQKSKDLEIGALQKYANVVELEKCCKMHIWVQKSASIQLQTSSLKFTVQPAVQRAMQRAVQRAMQRAVQQAVQRAVQQAVRPDVQCGGLTRA